MVVKKSSIAKKRKRIEAGYVLILAGLVFLGVAALLIVDSRDGKQSAPRQVLPSIRVAGGETPVKRGELQEVVARIGTLPGVDLRALDNLIRPALMEIAVSQAQDGFLQRLTRLCTEQGWKVLSRGDLGNAGRLRYSLGRYEPELILVVNLGVRDGSENRQAQSGIVPENRSNRRPRIALVLDDAGGDLALQWLFLDLPVKLNFAVIPGLPNSHRFARRARAAGHQVLIHLPMQPRAEEKQESGVSMLRPGMTARDIERILDGAVRSVPGAVALNNHMGSLATADRALMRLLMPAIRRRGLLFLDSRTHASSVAADEAGRAGLPDLTRDIFLDHVHKRTYIEEALRALVREAAKKGYAIGIGHVTCMETWQVLRDSLKKITEIGVEFVGITELK